MLVIMAGIHMQFFVNSVTDITNDFTFFDKYSGSGTAAGSECGSSSVQWMGVSPSS